MNTTPISLRIKVTKDILEQSKLCGEDNMPNAENCAIALAVRSIFPNAHIGTSIIYPFYAPNNDDSVGIDLPCAASAFICAFDDAGAEERVKMPELEFEVEIPDEVLQRIDISGLMPLLENHPTLELIESRL